MKQKKENRIALLLQWAGEQKIWLLLAILLAMASGLCIIVPYIGIYRLMDAAFQHICTKELVLQTVMMISVSVALRFVLFGCSGVAAHKGAYGALFKVRCMVAEHLAKVPLGTLNERRTGDIKTVLNEDIEKLELFLAHNLPDLVCYMVGPVAIFIYLMTVNIPLALVSLVPLILAVVVMGVMFRNTDGLMDRANRSITTLNSVMIEYISGMKLIKAYNMGSKSFQKFSGAIQEENAMWNETSRRMGPPYATFVVLIECGMLLMVPLGGMFFLKGSLAASAFLLFVYVGSMYLTEIRPLQELGTNFANVLGAITKTKEILDVPVYEGGMDFPENHDIELKNVRFSYDGKTDVLQGVNLKIRDGERMALVGQSGAGKSTVIELISRFYDVQEGEVLIGGINVNELNYDTILKNIAIVFQKTFLTRDSVLENIRMGSDASLEEVRAAAREAQIDDFIMSLPDGYDTKVGSFGSRFSGGEKQRIAIARAILKNAPILILDEATSASDPENQMEIDKAIQNLCKGRTVIVVAHRLSALKMCDRVAVVENHTITSVGTHEEVRKENAGKSTVIELISRFYDVQEGEVLIGGINVNELNYDTILKNIAIVFQKTFLTRDSVLENIRMGSDASLEEVRAAAREAQIDDFIMSLPDGYDTKVGSFGSRFSGGEKQRIAIARAILKNAPILILDEATSASDPENQMEIDKAIQNLCKGRTVIVVAHRLSALKMCDRVAVVENHTITSVGTHEEVRKENAYYRKAWEDYETARGITYQLEGGGQNESK